MFKSPFWLLTFFLLPVSSVMAFEPFEDTAENLAPQIETNRQVPNFKRANGTWTYAFELMLPDGSSRMVSEASSEIMVKPASTMKIFTGWFAYKKNFRDHEYLAKMLKESNNAMADTTLKNMGGSRAMKRFFADEGLVLNDKNFIQADGSGLSYNNKTNCKTEIELLKIIYRDNGYEDFKMLMAQPGEHGTLKERLPSLRGRVFAKTGTLAKTASLSGFVETSAGTMVFCVLTDYLPGPSRNYRPKIDAMVIKNVQNVRKRRY